MKNGKIKASDKIYPGTRLSINSIVKNIQEEYRNCTMTLSEGEIRVERY